MLMLPVESSVTASGTLVGCLVDVLDVLDRLATGILVVNNIRDREGDALLQAKAVTLLTEA